MEQTSSWYALYTKPRWEKKVAELLTRKNIENYCPLNKTMQPWHDRKKAIEEPLFTSYVFVRIKQKQQIDVRKTNGVINFVYWLGKPAIVRNEEIETIQRFLKEYKEVQVEKIPVKPNDIVRIMHGPFMSMEGKVLEAYHQKVKVMLPSLGYALVTQFEKASVEVIEVRKKSQAVVESSLSRYKIAQ